MPMCPGTFDQSSSSSTEFSDKNQIDIDHVIDLLLPCQYNICSFIFCFALQLQFPSLDSLFQSELHTRSTIINPQTIEGAAISSPRLTGPLQQTIQLLFIRQRMVINQMKMHRFGPVGCWTTKKTLPLYLESLLQKYFFS